jgi:hypothetical protein
MHAPPKRTAKFTLNVKTTAQNFFVLAVSMASPNQQKLTILTFLKQIGVHIKMESSVKDMACFTLMAA